MIGFIAFLTLCILVTTITNSYGVWSIRKAMRESQNS